MTSLTRELTDSPVINSSLRTEPRFEEQFRQVTDHLRLNGNPDPAFVAAAVLSGEERTVEEVSDKAKRLNEVDSYMTGNNSVQFVGVADRRMVAGVADGYTLRRGLLIDVSPDNPTEPHIVFPNMLGVEVQFGEYDSSFEVRGTGSTEGRELSLRVPSHIRTPHKYDDEVDFLSATEDGGFLAVGHGAVSSLMSEITNHDKNTRVPVIATAIQKLAPFFLDRD